MARIAIIDDDELLSTLITRTLEPLGHVVVAVANGDDALDVLWEFGPDLAILDCALPGKTGLAVLREIRESAMFGALPVLILTARRSEWHARLATEAGANGYMRKPFDAGELTAKIAALLAGPVSPHPGETILDLARLADLRETLGDAHADTLLKLMADAIVERTPRIVGMLAQGDHVAAAKHAHALRGAADGIGALDLSRHCHAIERLGETASAPLSACATATLAAIERVRRGAQAITSSA